jgi:putative membrane protein
MYHWHGWGWHMAGMWIFWVVVIVVLVLVIRWLAGSARGPETPRESAIDILKQRYARGEIDKEEYERKLSDLRR